MFQHMYDSLTETGYQAMIAGMDVEMPNCVCYNDELTEWFRSGKADIQILDRIVPVSYTHLDVYKRQFTDLSVNISTAAKRLQC